MAESEKEIQHRIMRHIGALPYLRVWRQNIGVARSMDGKRVIRYGHPGAADLTGVLACGIRLELEVKRRGGRQSKDQRLFQGVMDRMGAIYSVVDSEESVDQVLRGHLAGCSVCGDQNKW